MKNGDASGPIKAARRSSGPPPANGWCRTKRKRSERFLETKPTSNIAPGGSRANNVTPLGTPGQPQGRREPCRYRHEDNFGAISRRLAHLGRRLAGAQTQQPATDNEQNDYDRQNRERRRQKRQKRGADRTSQF